VISSDQSNFRKEWENQTKTGHFAISNRLRPSLKPTKRFKDLQEEREVWGRVVQCRTGHAFTGEFRKRFFPNEDVDCPCGEYIETREHILRECPRYEQHRHHLRSVSRDISVPEILGTSEGILALANFIRDSGAFTRTGKIWRPPEIPLFSDETYSEEADEADGEG